MKHPLKISNKNELRVHYMIFQPVIVPAFETFSCPTVSLDEIKQRRFSLIDRGKPKGV